MKSPIPTLILCLILCSCITEYLPPDIDTVTGILVVDGMITDDETVIKLSRSINLLERINNWSKYYINDARVYVECDDETSIEGSPDLHDYINMGHYLIKTGKLDINKQYRIKIEIDESDNKTSVYYSDFLYPLKTPEIDSLYYIKRGIGYAVMIHVETQSPDKSELYCRWSYKEDWEVHAEYSSERFPYYCWNKGYNPSLLLASSENNFDGKLNVRITTLAPRNRRFSVLYRIDVNQNALRKQAYDYFANIQRNDQQISSIFAPIPSELRGNIYCESDPDRLVIGYVDVSLTSKKRMYIPRSANVYEPVSPCMVATAQQLNLQYETDFIRILQYYELVPNVGYVDFDCVNCTYWGTEDKPKDWPNDY